jgi:hypothetical protein
MKTTATSKKTTSKKTTSSKKATTKNAAAEPRKNQPIPFLKIAKLYTEGKTMEQIAKAIDRYNESYPDPTKSVRAIVSGMITKGYTNDADKVVKLKKRARGGVVEVVKGKKAEKKATEPKKATASPRKKAEPVLATV